MIDGSHLNAAGGYAEGRVLNSSLEFLNKGWWDVGEPNGSCICEKRPDKRHIGDKYGFRTSRNIEDVKYGVRPE